MTDIMSVHVFADSATPATARQITEHVQNSDDTVYVLYSHPSVYVAAKLADGVPGNEACKEWLDGINECFTAHKKNRRRIRVLCVEDALKNREKRLNTELFSANQIQNLATQPSEIMLLAGHYLTSHNSEIATCLERLEALTMHLSDKPYGLDINVTAVIDRGMEFNDEQQDRLEMLFVEKQTLKQQSEEQLAKITELRGWCKIHEEREEKLKGEIESVSKERDDALARSNKEAEELILVKQQLDEVQHQLETTFIQGHEEKEAKITELREWCKIHEEREEKLKDEIESLTKQRDDAVNQNNTTTDELKVTQQQLDQVQVQLENTYIEGQEKAKDLNKAKDKVRELQKWCRIHESRQAELNDKLQQYKQRNKDLESETHQLIEFNQELREKLANLTNELELERARAREQIANLNIQLAQSFEEVKAHSIKNKNLTQQSEQPALHSAESELSKETSTVTDFGKKSDRDNHFLRKIKGRLRLGKHKKAERDEWVREQAMVIEESPLFDADWYIEQYPDLKNSRLKPAEHYLRFGGFEGRNPSKQFDSAFYLSMYPDVAKEGINPLLHFILYGEAEGRHVKPKACNKFRKDA